MTAFSFGVVGTGMIADVIAGALRQIRGVELTAVASRRPQRARAFAQAHAIARVYDDWQTMMADDTLDAVYVATPTAVREAICLAALAHGKHLLADKPFASCASLQRITALARDKGLAFMDATHFVHNPRSEQIKQTLYQRVGNIQAVHTAFFFPFLERGNIRFDPDQEPTGAVGDMGWYCMRAIVEYLSPQADIATVAGGVVRDAQTGAVLRGTGVLVFDDGKSSTFDFGYNAGVCLMELDILGENGVLQLDDFVLDRKQGFGFDDRHHIPGYTVRSGMQTPAEAEYVHADSEEPQAVLMLRHFIGLAEAPASAHAQASMQRSEQTQYLLDRYWKSVKN